MDMEKGINEYRQFLIARLGYFRNKSKLSARELSQRLGFSPSYIAKFEMGVLNMPSEVLLDAMKVLNVSPEKFFSKNPDRFDENNEIMECFNSMSDRNKQIVKSLIKELK